MSPEFAPHMSSAELALLAKVLPKDASVLEFGCGGSTQFFFEHNAKFIVSIDSDNSWLEMLLTNPVVSTFHKYGRWRPLHADIGPIISFGRPEAQTPDVCWLNYHQYCWSKFSERDFDFILIDGRFRVACTCQSLLRCNKPGVLFAIHDFWNRPEYHILLKFFDVIDRADSLGIFKAKQKIDWQELNLVLQDHQFDYD